MKIRRAAAYGVCRSADGSVLLARGSELSAFPGVWSLPGGGVEHGEHPADAVVREFGEETGLLVAVTGVRAVVADVIALPDGPVEHTDRIIYDVTVQDGVLRAEADGTTDLAAWLTPATVAEVPLLPFTAHALGAPSDLPAVPDDDEPVRRGTRVQRFGAYGLVTDPAGRVLLARITEGYPGGGQWHLPGGGTDFGETPEQGLLRELDEETSQRGRVDGLLTVGHRYDPAALGPEGIPMDWHVIRVVYRVRVDEPVTASVTEAAGGSTDRASWFTLGEVGELPLTELAQEALAHTG
ncbi:NUDIX domain-containing protein [Actinoplanes awajinensis]|uniref:NUDIX hydrolase n=1 Tax=Actinoplanes awajinensis subsp. mycoplanecinus TaxID=135947 RepID=A0A0X3UVN5_9ACTN|nr:NUDIX domain-containing protein [Actinoplanes awajinensis]KUL36591.1 NUDIX hydrolase [Actinoplanes awajinensis subsp. mycoplanecinus]